MITCWARWKAVEPYHLLQQIRSEPAVTVFAQLGTQVELAGLVQNLTDERFGMQFLGLRLRRRRRRSIRTSAKIPRLPGIQITSEPAVTVVAQLGTQVELEGLHF